MTQWTYRPTEEEQEQLLRFLKESGEYASIAKVIREGVLRLIHDRDRRPLFSELADQIEQLRDYKERFLSTVMRELE